MFKEWVIFIQAKGEGWLFHFLSLAVTAAWPTMRGGIEVCFGRGKKRVAKRSGFQILNPYGLNM